MPLLLRPRQAVAAVRPLEGKACRRGEDLVMAGSDSLGTYLDPPSPSFSSSHRAAPGP